MTNKIRVTSPFIYLVVILKYVEFFKGPKTKTVFSVFQQCIFHYVKYLVRENCIATLKFNLFI